jgi:hypothetical protein
VLIEFLRYVGMLGRAFEQHVFEQMRHARFSVTFVPRAD